MRTPALIVLTLLAVHAAAPGGPAAAQRMAQPDFGVGSRAGLVVSATGVASDVGAVILSRGGNAVDAAVATAMALAVTHPTAGNLGGGGFMIVRTPDGRTAAFDYREKAPGKATPTMYLGKDGNIDRSLTAAGYLAPGVPGTVRGMAHGAREVRQAAVARHRRAGGRSRGEGVRGDGVTRARSQLAS